MDGKDLILSFAVLDPGDPTEIESLILLRTPVYESLLDAAERGVTVSFERYQSDDDDFLEEAYWNAETATIRLKTQMRTYELDLRKVDRRSLSAMRKVLKKMNFDRRIRLSGI